MQLSNEVRATRPQRLIRLTDHGLWNLGVSGKPHLAVGPEHSQRQRPQQRDPNAEWGQVRMPRGKQGQKMDGGVDGAVEQDGDQDTSSCA